jgi:hypothetical protein
MSNEIDQADVVLTTITRELARTAVTAARQIQRIVERENRDLDIEVAIHPSSGDADFVLAVEPIDQYVACLIGDSPSCLLRRVRGVMRLYRQSLADDDGISFEPSDN